MRKLLFIIVGILLISTNVSNAQKTFKVPTNIVTIPIELGIGATKNPYYNSAHFGYEMGIGYNRLFMSVGVSTDGSEYNSYTGTISRDMYPEDIIGTHKIMNCYFFTVGRQFILPVKGFIVLSGGPQIGRYITVQDRYDEFTDMGDYTVRESIYNLYGITTRLKYIFEKGIVIGAGYGLLTDGWGIVSQISITIGYDLGTMFRF